jgi:hypothetical protein
MNQPHISVAALMRGVSFVAVGLAALKYPTPLAASALATLLQGSLAVALLGAVLRRGPRRAFWVGFAVCGGAYALLAFDLSPSPATPRPQLVTVELLVLLKASLAGEPAATLPWLTTVDTTRWDLFAQVGQSLVALLAGSLGGLLGRHFAATGGGGDGDGSGPVP